MRRKASAASRACRRLTRRPSKRRCSARACSENGGEASGQPAELAELGEDVAVELALERHDEPRQLGRRHPFPRVELGMPRGEVDVAILAGEAHGEPFLHLAAIALVPDTAGDALRPVIAQPLRAFREELGLVGADLLLELAQRRRARCLAAVDAALRHLPVVAGHVDAAADEDAVLRVEQHDADAGAVALGARRFGAVAHLPAPGATPPRNGTATTRLPAVARRNSSAPGGRPATAFYPVSSRPWC